MADNAEDFEFDIEGVDDIEVVDDTPEEDRDRAPMPKELVEELEADELEDYSEKVKIRLKQTKKVWHDERREKEREQREKNEATSLAQRLLDENRRLKSTLQNGEKTLVSSYQTTAEMEAAEARRAFKEAYESGDSEAVIKAQEQLTRSNYRLEQLKNYVPTVQVDEPVVENRQEVASPPRPDARSLAWQERNTWYGTDEEMTASALGLHQKLIKQYGPTYVGTDEYWHSIDNTMRRRFPEYFGESEKTASGNTKSASRTETRPANVVAPASRSTSAKKIVLTKSQAALAAKFGLTPKQYAQEVLKMEKK